MDRDVIKPAALRQGDRVAIVSPSSAGINRFPDRTTRAFQALRNFGLEPVLAPNAVAALGDRAGHPLQRAEDVMWAFESTDIRGVFAAIGGLSANEILPLLDFESIRRNPKVFVGYSDITALLIAIYSRSNVVTFHGPALLPQWGEFPVPFLDTTEFFRKICFEANANCAVPKLPQWTDEYCEWMSDRPRKRILKPSKEWHWLKPGRARGLLFGGNVDTLNVLCGTPYLRLPKHDSLVFLEATAVSPGNFRRAINQLLQAGLFDSCRGILFAKYNPEDQNAAFTQSEGPHQMDNILLDVLGILEVPIVTGVDFGHTDPMITLPIGIEATISSVEDSIILDENAVVF